MRSAHRLMLVNVSMTFHEDILYGFQITKRTRFCGGQTERRPWQKTICLPTLKPPNTKICLDNFTIHLTFSTFMQAISDYQVQVLMVYCDLGQQPIPHETMTNIQKHCWEI